MRKLLFIVVLLLLVLQPAAAQEILQLDQLSSGELTPERPTASYFVALKTGQSLHLQAVAASGGLVLQGALSTAAGALVQTIPNPTNSPTLDTEITASANGIFRLDISSANASFGQFVLLVQELAPLEPDAELALNEPLSDTLQPDETIAYALSGDPIARLILDITTDNPQDSIDVQLLDANGSVIASLQTQETGGELLVPAGRRNYQLALSNPQQTAVGFEVALTSLDGPISTPVSTPEVTLPPVTSTTTCTVTPLNTIVNVRTGPSTQFNVFTSLQYGATMTGVARNPEGTWYQVDTGAGLGWVSAGVVATNGPCTSLQVVFIPTPTFSPPTETPTAQATTVAQRCAPAQTKYLQSNGAYMVVSLPAADVGEVMNYQDGYHTQYVFPTCRAILWTSLTFTCRASNAGGAPRWVIGDFANFDWNATCGSNTNHNQPGLSFGVE